MTPALNGNMNDTIKQLIESEKTTKLVENKIVRTSNNCFIKIYL